MEGEKPQPKRLNINFSKNKLKTFFCSSKNDRIKAGTLGGGYMMQYTGHVSEMYIIFLTNVTPIHLIKRVWDLK